MNDRPTLITFASPKGGVGKSTSCLSIAGTLSKAGHPVRIIDLDQNATLLRWGDKYASRIPNLIVETVHEDQLGPHLLNLVRTTNGYILLDLAGSLSTTMLQCAALADLTITPAKLSEPDIMEATKLFHQIKQVGDACGREICHRILINERPALIATYQAHVLRQIENSPLKCLSTHLHHRAAYAEQFLTGDPAAFADQSRPPIKKATTELQGLLDEILSVIHQDANEEAEAA